MTLKKNNSKAADKAQLVFQEGVALLQQGKSYDADKLLEEAHQLNPNNVDVLNLMGIRLYQKQDYPRALKFLNKANQLAARSPQTLANIGLTMNALSKFSEALHFLDLAIASNPNIPEIHNNRGNALKGLQKNEEAIAAYTQAISLRSNYAEALSNKGVLLMEAGETHNAIPLFELAIQANSNFAIAFNNLGNALTHMGEYAKAFQCYERALQINPYYLDACLNLGSSLKKERQFDDAINCYQQALTLDSHQAKTYYLLGDVYYDIGDTLLANTYYKKSKDLDPINLETQLALTIAQIPKVYENHQQYLESRTSFKNHLEILKSGEHVDLSLDIGSRLISKHPFYLAYQDENNKPLLAQFGRLNALQARSIQHQIPQIQPIKNRKKIHLGIVSHYFCTHPVWDAITKGWVGHLNPNIFDVFLFNTNGVVDDETQWADAMATKYINCGSIISKAAEFISQEDVDILLYPELGMDPTSKALACLRLAPIQAVSWGHPETTGLPTIDFYLSGELLEPKNGEIFYTEELVRLPDFGNLINELPVKPIHPNLQKLGLHKNSPILICAGSPSKYLPINDDALVDIANALESCQLVFFNFEERLTNQLMKRLDIAFSSAQLDVNEYVKTIPFLPREEFLGLMLEADLYLDTIGFSGFNTALQAISCDLPIITIEGNRMRGRLASAILRKLGLQEYICASKTAYVNLAALLIKNRHLLETYKASIKNTKTSLLNTSTSIKSLEEFLISQFKKLPKNL